MIEWTHQEIADTVQLLRKCDIPAYPLVYERKVFKRDLWTAYIGPYYVSIWSGDLFYTVQINHGPSTKSLIGADLGDAKWNAISWIDEQLDEIKKETEAAWQLVQRHGDRAL